MTISEPSANAQLRRGLTPILALLVLAGCEKDTAQLVQEIDAAREGCTEEMLEAGAEECVQMFEKYIEMGTGAIETYIGAMRAFDAAVDRGPTTRFDTTGLGRAISPELLNPAATRGGSSLPLRTPQSLGEETPRYAEDIAGPRTSASSNSGSRPAYLEPEASWEFDPASADAPGQVYDPRRPVAPAQQQTPRRGAILPPAERLERPWIGDGNRQEEYYPNTAERREELERLAEDPRTRRPQPSERPPL